MHARFSRRKFRISFGRLSDRLAIFNYHRIATAPGQQTAFDDNLYGPDAATFRDELITMKTIADPVSENDLISFFNNGTPLPKRGFMITFDDGYRDNFDLALPILRELNIPAIFFVPTEAIEKRKLGWWDQIHWFFKQTKKSQIVVGGETFKVVRPINDLAETFSEKMKALDADETKTLIMELSEACEVAPPSKEVSDAELMSWEQIIEADRLGIAIGGHSHTHRVLSCLDIETQKMELKISKQILEAKLGKPIRSVAYPVGGYEHFHRETMCLARECGYDLGFSFLTGVNQMKSLEPFNIKRMGHQNDPAIYAGVINFPWIFEDKPRRSHPQSIFE